jgi:acetoacetate decarboxylase
MRQTEIAKNAFAMPFTRPIYPPGPYRFINREYLIITYETDRAKLEAIVPQPLELAEPFVKYEFIRMPDSSGFGNYTESGQIIPVVYKRKAGNYVHSMYLDCEPPIAAGREIWGFPKTLANPSLEVASDVLLGKLLYQGVQVALGTMAYKYKQGNIKAIQKEFSTTPNYLLKIIPHVDGTARICELVTHGLTDVEIKGAWEGPGELELVSHAMAPVADLPVRKIISSLHIITDLTLPYGQVIHDYLS